MSSPVTITLIQFSEDPFFGETPLLTLSTSISAPPPGRPCIPDSRNLDRTSMVDRPETSDIPSISMGEKQSKAIEGCLLDSSDSNSVYHSKSSEGLTPPCIRILEPPSSSSSSILALIWSRVWAYPSS